MREEGGREGVIDSTDILNRSPYAREGGASGQRELLYGNSGTKKTNYAEMRKSVRIINDKASYFYRLPDLMTRDRLNII